MNITKYSLVASVAIMLLTGCGGGGDNSNGETTVSNTEDIFDPFGNGVGVSPVGRAVFSYNAMPDSTSTHYKINSLSANACKGTATYSPSDFTAESNSTQEVTFSIAFGDFEKCITDKITFDYSIVDDNGHDFPFTKKVFNPTYNQDKVYKQAGTDPLYQYQWHLKNTGQRVGVSTPAVAGNDIDVQSVWDSGVTGKGVTVAVIDTGVDMFHPDLKDNLLMNLSHNYHTGNLVGNNGEINNPTPVRYLRTSSGGYHDYAHGTAVAGLIAAKGWNGIGTRGVSPDAKLVSYNALETYADEAKNLYEARKVPYNFSDNGLVHYRLVNALTRNIDKIDIYNNSWGSSNETLKYDIPTVNYEDTLKNGATQGRNGKGAIYVKAAGNGGGWVNDRWQSWANFEPMQTNGYFIVVGASGSDGVVSKYSTRGPNLLVNAPGGGSQYEYVKPDLHEIVTTDMASKERGFDSDIPYLSNTQHFDVKGNENYDYTQNMNGTSSASPIVAGVVALMLEKNPDLTWRDVRYILARTATKNDPDNSTWNKNGAGYWYSFAYGFGRVDAARAVEMAENFSSLGNLYDMKSTSGAGGFKESSNGVVSDTATIQDNITIEHVKINLDLNLTAKLRYKTYDFSGTRSTTTNRFMLYKGYSLITIRSSFASDGNDTQTNVKLIQDGEVVGDDDAQDLGTITFEKQDSISKRVTIDNPDYYRLKVDSNASSWSVSVKTPLPHPMADQILVTLTSPSGTKTILANAPNDLNSSTEDYVDVTLSSVEFLDEKSAGTWTLDVKDTNWTNDSDTTYNLNRWKLDITGR